MENRKPFQIRHILIAYNFLQVLLSAYIFKEAMFAGWFTGYSWTCEPVDYSRSPEAMRVWQIFKINKYNIKRSERL